MPEFETLGYGLADGVATLSLNRPGVLNSLPEQLDLEANIQRIRCASEDFVEGVTAFIEKRQPRFKGR